MDRYTKVVLTVIAAALCVLAVQNVIHPAQSQASLQRVAICDVDGTNCVGVWGSGTLSSPRRDGELAVKSANHNR